MGFRIATCLTAAATALAVAAPSASADALSEHVHPGGGPAAVAAPPTGAGTPAGGPPSAPAIGSGSKGSPAGGPPSTPLPSGVSGGSAKGQPPVPKVTPTPSSGGGAATTTPTTSTATATGGGPAAHKHPVTVAGGGAAPSAPRAARAAAPAAVGGGAPAGALPYTGPRNVIALVLAALAALGGGLLFYRKASRRERAVRFITSRFAWRPVHELDVEPLQHVEFQLGAPAVAPPLPQPVHLDDSSRFAWATSGSTR